MTGLAAPAPSLLRRASVPALESDLLSGHCGQLLRSPSAKLGRSVGCRIGYRVGYRVGHVPNSWQNCSRSCGSVAARAGSDLPSDSSSSSSESKVYSEGSVPESEVRTSISQDAGERKGDGTAWDRGRGAEGTSFKDRYTSNYFDGVDKFAVLKAATPIQVLVGVGVLLALLLPPLVAAATAALLLLPPAVALLLQTLKLLPNPAMDGLIPGRFTARMEGDFCVLLIGARNNAPWKLTKKFIELGMSFDNMIRELESLPVETSGFLGAENFVATNWSRSSHGLVVVYWRSYEDLLRYAHSPTMKHVPTWLSAEKEHYANPEIGFWHEAYQVVGGKYDSIYVNCPPLGLGKCAEIRPAVGRFRSSRGRSGASDGSDLPKHITEPSSY